MCLKDACVVAEIIGPGSDGNNQLIAICAGVRANHMQVWPGGIMRGPGWDKQGSCPCNQLVLHPRLSESLVNLSEVCGQLGKFLATVDTHNIQNALQRDFN
jgi:hypothetical protein